MKISKLIDFTFNQLPSATQPHYPTYIVFLSAQVGLTLKFFSCAGFGPQQNQNWRGYSRLFDVWNSTHFFLSHFKTNGFIMDSHLDRVFPWNLSDYPINHLDNNHWINLQHLEQSQYVKYYSCRYKSHFRPKIWRFLWGQISKKHEFDQFCLVFIWHFYALVFSCQN